jgi:hypothetical protein
MRSGSREASAVFSPSPPPMMRQHSPRAWLIPVESRARLCHRIVLSLASSAHTVVLLAGKFVGAWHPPPDLEKEQQGQDGRQNTRTSLHPASLRFDNIWGRTRMHARWNLSYRFGGLVDAQRVGSQRCCLTSGDDGWNIEHRNIEYRISNIEQA